MIVITRRIGEFVRGWSAMRQQDKRGWIPIGFGFEESTGILQLPASNLRTNLDLNNENRTVSVEDYDVRYSPLGNSVLRLNRKIGQRIIQHIQKACFPGFVRRFGEQYF